MKNKIRLDQLLVDLGHMPDLKTAITWVMTERVQCNGVVVSKPGHMVETGAAITLRGSLMRFVSRGGYKLQHALREFSVDVEHLVVLDAGASTGGFTDCLVQRGARKVYAVDVGYGQLRGALATNPRVKAMEKTNISDLTLESFSDPLDLAVIDLSYLPLLRAIPVVAKCFIKPVRLICLFKPLYEGLPREGMTNLGSIRQVFDRFLLDLAQSPYRARNVVVSPILGGSGTIELLLLVDQGSEPSPDAHELAEQAIRLCTETPPIPGHRAAELP